MKLLRSYFVQSLLFVLAVVGMNSCSCNKKETIEDKIKYLVSDKVDLVAAVNLEELLKATEISVNKDGQLVMPDYITNIGLSLDSYASRSFNEVIDAVTEFKGINFTNIVIAVDNVGTDKFEGMIMFNVTDEDDFFKSVEDAGGNMDVKKDQVEGFKVAEGQYGGAILIKDDLAIIPVKANMKKFDAEKCAELIKKWEDAAEASPMADWKVTYIKDTSIASILMSMKFIEKSTRYMDQDARMFFENSGINFSSLYMGMKLNVSGSSMSIASDIFNSDGSAANMDIFGTIDTDLLKYATDKDIAFGAVDMSAKTKELIRKAAKAEFEKERRNARDYYYDSDSRMSAIDEEEAMMDAALDAINGTIMVAAGPAENASAMSINWEDPRSYHFVAAVALNEKNKREIFETICNALSTDGAPAGNTFKTRLVLDSQYDYYSNAYLEKAIDLYIQLDGNIIVISNSPISSNGSSNLSNNAFAGKGFALQLNIDKTNPLIRDFALPYGVDFSYGVASSSCSAQLTLTGTNANFIPAIIKTITNLGR